MRNRRAVFSLLLAVTLLPAFLSGQIRPKVTVSPTFAPPKSLVLATGKGFAPTSLVTISLDTQQIGEALTNASGAFSRARVNIPSGTPEGPHFIKVSDPTGVVVTIPFTILTNWSMRRFDPQNTANNPYEWKLDTSTVTALTAAWYTTVVPCDQTTAIVANAVVYYNSATGGLQALDSATGALLWSFDMSSPTSGNCGTSPAATVSPTGKGLVFVQNQAGKVYAIDVNTHLPVWTYQNGGTFYDGYPVPVGNTVFLENLDGAGAVTALNRLSGTLKWSIGLVDSSNVECQPYAVAWRSGAVYVASYGYCGLSKLNDSTGQVVWGNPVTGDAPLYPVAASKMVYAEHLGIASSTGKILFDDGRLDAAELALDNGQLYSVRGFYSGINKTDDLCAFNATTGSQLWCLTPPGSVPFADGAEIVANGIVYVGAETTIYQAVIAVDRNGNILMQKVLAGASVNGYAPLPSAVVDGTLYVESFASTTGDPATFWAFR